MSMGQADGAASDGLVCCEVVVIDAWVDAEGRLRPAFHTAAFDGSIDHLKNCFGLGAAVREQHRRSTVALEARLTLHSPAWLGERLVIESRIFDFDAKRLHIAQVLRRDDTLVATRESMAISFDLDARRSCPFQDTIAANIARLHAAQQALVPWTWMGRQRLTLSELEQAVPPH